MPLQLPSQLLLVASHHVGPQLSPPFHVQHPPVLGVGVGTFTGAAIVGAEVTGVGVGTGSMVGVGLLVGLDCTIVISAQFQN